MADVNRVQVEYFANLFDVKRAEGERDRHFMFRVSAAMIQEQAKQSEDLVQVLHGKHRIDGGKFIQSPITESK
jgi:hypothetical protein